MKNFTLFVFTMAVVAATFSSCDILDPNEHGQLVPKTVDEDPSLPSISVNGTMLHAETFGNPNNPMIVVLHGGPGGDYRGMLKCSKFSEDGFFVVFYDQRGSGLSKRHSKDTYYSEKIFIDDLDAVIKYYRRPGQKVILMGLSWGAMLATGYVNSYPSEISGVVMMEPGGFIWRDAEAFIARQRSVDVMAENINDLLYLDQIITSSDHILLDYKMGLMGASENSEGNKLGNAGPTPTWRSGAVVNAAAFDIVRRRPFDFTTNLSQYRTKVLFAYGELDVAYGKAHAELVSSAYPNVQLVEIKGCGHEIPYEGFDTIYPIAKAYLDTIK
jgi:proline iminopeptidase